MSLNKTEQAWEFLFRCLKGLFHDFAPLLKDCCDVNLAYSYQLSPRLQFFDFSQKIVKIRFPQKCYHAIAHPDSEVGFPISQNLIHLLIFFTKSSNF